MTEDPALKFKSALGEALNRLRAKSAPSRFSSDRGNHVTGWIVKYGEPQENMDGAFRRLTAYTRILVSTDGELWEYAEESTDLLERPYTRTTACYLQKLDRSAFVGRKGEPFSEMISTLSRVGW